MNRTAFHSGFFCLLQFNELKNTEWYAWAIKNSELVNTLGMGAKIGEKGLNYSVLGKWINAMGVSLKGVNKRVVALQTTIASLKDNLGSATQVISEYAQLLNGFEVEDIKSWRISVPTPPPTQ